MQGGQKPLSRRAVRRVEPSLCNRIKFIIRGLPQVSVRPFVMPYTGSQGSKVY